MYYLIQEKVYFYEQIQKLSTNKLPDLVLLKLVAFFSLARILGECSTIHSLPALFFFFFFKVKS